MTAFVDQQQLAKLCRSNDVAFLGLFGSFARGEATDRSDVDLLVRFSKRKSLLAVLSFEDALAQTFGRQVDLVTEAALSPYLRERILKDVQVMYEA